MGYLTDLQSALAAYTPSPTKMKQVLTSLQVVGSLSINFRINLPANFVVFSKVFFTRPAPNTRFLLLRLPK